MRKILLFSFLLVIVFLMSNVSAKPYYSTETYGCFKVTWKGWVGVTTQNYLVKIQELCGRNRYINPTVVVDNFRINPNKIRIKLWRVRVETVEENTTIPVEITNTYNYSENYFMPPILNKSDLVLYPNCWDNGDNSTFTCREVIYENTTELKEKQVDRKIDYVVERYRGVVKAKVTDPIFVKSYGETILRVKIKYKHAVRFKKKWVGGRVGIIIDGHLYHPWWDTSWSYRKMLSIDDYKGWYYPAPQLFIINITKYPEMNDDYSDVRLTIIDEYLNEVDIPFVFVKKTPNYAIAIAKIETPYDEYVFSQTASESAIIYLYYGNPNPPPLPYVYSDFSGQYSYFSKELFRNIATVVRSYGNDTVAVSYSLNKFVWPYEFNINWKFIDGASGSYIYNSLYPRTGFVSGLYVDDDYLYIPFGILSINNYRWYGFLLRVNRSNFTDTYLLSLGINVFPYDVVSDNQYLYVIGRYGGNTHIIKVDKNMTILNRTTVSLSSGTDYLYYPAKQDELCAFAYAYTLSNFDVHYLCWNNNLTIIKDKVLFSNTRIYDVEVDDVGRLFLLLQNNTILVYNKTTLNVIKSIQLPSAGYDMSVLGSMLLVKLGNSIMYYDYDTGNFVTLTASRANRATKCSVNYNDGFAHYFLIRNYAYYATRWSTIDTHLRSEDSVEYAPRIEWYNAIPIWVYNNDSINYSHVVLHTVLNRSEGMFPDLSDILVTLPTSGYWSYVPYYIPSYNDTHFEIAIYLGNVSAFENRSLLVRFNKSINFTPFFMNNPFFTYPIFVGNISWVMYKKGITGYINNLGLGLTRYKQEKTINLSVPFVIYVEDVGTNDPYIYMYVYNDENQLKYIARFYIYGTQPVALMDNQSNVICSGETSFSLPWELRITLNGTLIIREGNSVCTAPIDPHDRYYIGMKTYYFANHIKKLIGYSYLVNYIVDPPISSTYGIDIETLNNPPEITIYSPKEYAYYNTPILKFKVVDDTSESLLVKVILDNATVYENTNYSNGTIMSIDLSQFINQTTYVPHIVSVVAYDWTSYTYSDEIPFYYAPFEFYTLMKSDFIELYDSQQINLSTTLVNTTNFIIEWWYSDFDTTYPATNTTIIPNCSLPWCNATYEIPCQKNSFVYFNAYVTNGTDTYKAGTFSYICGGLPLASGVTTPTPVAGLSPNTELDVKSFATTVGEGQCINDTVVVELKHDWLTYDATMEIYDFPSNMIYYPKNVVIKPGSNLIDVSICGVKAGDYAGRIVVTLDNGIQDSAEISVHVRSFSQGLMELITSKWAILIILLGLVLWSSHRY